MMSDEHDDNGDRVGRGQPPKHSQFKPGRSGNPRGRPRKPRRALLPSQGRKDVLEVADEVLEIKTSKGIKRLTTSQIIIRGIANGAAKGNPTCLKLWLGLLKEAAQERFDTYPSVSLTDTLMKIVEDPRTGPDKLMQDALDDLLRKTKRLY